MPSCDAARTPFFGLFAHSFPHQQSTAEIPLAPSRHVPVMLREVLQQLELTPGLTVLDGTVGAGGHSREIAQRIGSDGVLIGLDRDPMMLAHAAEKVSGSQRFLQQASYSEARQVLNQLAIGSVDRVLLDLGLSSDQLADGQRGFGYALDAPLDMRFDVRVGESARDFVNQSDAAAMEEVFREYGEERFSREIAAAIVARRRVQPLETTRDLIEAVESAIPERFLREARKEPATRVFQALRIAVNRELEHLEQALQRGLYDVLAPGGRIVIITFHSLEDRIVKTAFRDEERWLATTKKPILPSPAETRMNPRSRSAKVRSAMKK